MTYKVIKNDKEREYKVGDIIGIPDKYKGTADKLIKEGIIKALSKEEADEAFDELRKEK